MVFGDRREGGKQWVLQDGSLAQGGCSQKWPFPGCLLDVAFVSGSKRLTTAC